MRDNNTRLHVLASGLRWEPRQVKSNWTGYIRSLLAPRPLWLYCSRAVPCPDISSTEPGSLIEDL